MRARFDTYTHRRDADDHLHVYAELLSHYGLTRRFRVSVKPDYPLDRYGKRIPHRAPTWDIVLTDHSPDEPLPKFLKSENFSFERPRSRSELQRNKPLPMPLIGDRQQETEPEISEEEDETSTGFRIIPGALYSVHGQSKTLRDWADAVGISYQTLIARLRSGWTLEDALTRPVQRRSS